MLWSQYGLTGSEKLKIHYRAEFRDGTVDEGEVVTTPLGKVIWFSWWQGCLILCLPALLFFFRILNQRALVVFGLLYVVVAFVVVTHTEEHPLVNAFGVLAFISLLISIYIIVKRF